MRDWTESEWFRVWLSLARHTRTSDFWEHEVANQAEPARVSRRHPDRRALQEIDANENIRGLPS